jgi:hypothetical protein
MKGDLIVTIKGDVPEVFVPRLAGVDAQLITRLTGNEIPGAFNVSGGEGLAIMPFDALAQANRQFSLVLAP